MPGIPPITFSIVADTEAAIKALKTLEQAADRVYKILNKIGPLNKAILSNSNKIEQSERIRLKTEEQLLKTEGQLLKNKEHQAKIDQIIASTESKKAIEAQKLLKLQQQITKQAQQQNKSGGGGNNGGMGGFGQRIRMFMGVRGVSQLIGASGLPGSQLAMRGIMGGGELAYGAGATGLGGIAAGAGAGIVVAGALAAIGEFVKIIGDGVEDLASIITQLGGFQGIVGSIVSGLQAQRNAISALGNIAPENRGALNFANVGQRMMNLAQDTPWGAEIWGQGLGASNKGKMFESMKPFITSFGRYKNITPADIGERMGDILKANPNFTQEQVENALLLQSTAAQYGGSIVGKEMNIAKSGGYITGRRGAQTAMALTALSGGDAAAVKKYAEYRAGLGLSTSSAGMLSGIQSDINKSPTERANMEPAQRKLIEDLERLGKGFTDIENKVENTTSAFSDMQTAAQDVSNTAQDQLLVAFNNIKNSLTDDAKPAIDDLAGKINSLASSLDSNKELLTTIFSDLGKAAYEAALALGMLAGPTGTILKGAGEVLDSPWSWAIGLVPGFTAETLLLKGLNAASGGMIGKSMIDMGKAGEAVGNMTDAIMHPKGIGGGHGKSSLTPLLTSPTGNTIGGEVSVSSTPQIDTGTQLVIELRKMNSHLITLNTSNRQQVQHLQNAVNSGTIPSRSGHPNK